MQNIKQTNHAMFFIIEVAMCLKSRRHILINTLFIIYLTIILDNMTMSTTFPYLIIIIENKIKYKNLFLSII